MASLRPLLLLLIVAAVSVNCQRRTFGRKIQAPPPLAASVAKQRSQSSTFKRRATTRRQDLPPRTTSRRARPQVRTPVRSFGVTNTRTTTSGRSVAGPAASRRFTTTTRKPSQNFGAARRTRPTPGRGSSTRGRLPPTSVKPARASNARGRATSKARTNSFASSRSKQKNRKQTGFRGGRKPTTRGGFKAQTSSNKRSRFRGSQSQAGRNEVSPPNSITRAGTRQSQSQKPRVDFNCPDVNGTYADEKQCDKYFRCVNGEATEEQCPDGLVFHPDRVYPCVYPTEAECTTTQQKADSTEDCPRQFATFKDVTDPKDCGSYTKCVSGIAHPWRCPQGLAFNSRSLGCEWADLVEECGDVSGYLGFSCPQREFSPQEVGDFTKEPHPTNCTQFYLCMNSERGQVMPRLQGCPDAMVFNKDTKECTDRLEDAPGCEGAIAEEVLSAFQQRRQDETDRRERRLKQLKASFFS